jgi:hypothetical protein
MARADGLSDAEHLELISRLTKLLKAEGGRAVLDGLLVEFQNEDALIPTPVDDEVVRWLKGEVDTFIFRGGRLNPWLLTRLRKQENEEKDSGNE